MPLLPLGLSRPADDRRGDGGRGDEVVVRWAATAARLGDGLPAPSPGGRLRPGMT